MPPRQQSPAVGERVRDVCLCNYLSHGAARSGNGNRGGRWRSNACHMLGGFLRALQLHQVGRTDEALAELSRARWIARQWHGRPHREA